MKKYMLTILLLPGFLTATIFAAETVPSASEVTVKPAEPGEPVAVGQTKIDDYLMRWHRNVSNAEDKNIVSSPFGAARIGEMLYDGAGGKTKEALRQAFLTTLTRTTLKDPAIKETENWYRLPKDETAVLPFTEVNGLWLQKGFAVLPTYVAGLREKFVSETAEADFTENAEAECAKINAWVEKATEGKIETLFEKVDANTKLAVANAISFFGKWDAPFDPEETKMGAFHYAPWKSVEMPFMRKTMRVGYRENFGMQSIDIPYERNRCSMVVILPQENRCLREIESSIVLDGTVEYPLELVDIRLPKFEIETEIDLKPVLTAMGAGIAFDSNEADFSAMSGSGGLYVGQAAQKAVVRVDESGTEAAAATGAAAGLKSRPAEEVTPKTFHADRPFLFVIWENTTNTPLFIGRFVKP